MALFPKIQDTILPAHEFAAAIHYWCQGHVTRSNVINYFNLELDDEAQLDQIKAAFDAKTTLLDEVEYLFRVEHTFILIQAEAINLTLAKSVLEVT